MHQGLGEDSSEGRAPKKGQQKTAFKNFKAHQAQSRQFIMGKINTQFMMQAWLELVTDKYAISNNNSMKDKAVLSVL